MSLKWKIFRVINIIQLVYAISFDIAIFSILVRNNFSEWILTSTIVILIFTLIGLNSYLNLFVLNRNFPDKFPRKNFQIFHRVIFILNLLIVLGIIVVFYLELASIFKDESVKLSEDLPYIIFIFVILVVLAYTVTVQYQLIGFLKENHEAGLKRLIDSIGKETNE